jgi:hypothetical protein
MPTAASVDSSSDFGKDVDPRGSRSTHEVRRVTETLGPWPERRQEDEMRYMLIMLVEREAAAQAAEMDMAEMFAVMGAYNDELQKAGVFLAAEGLSDLDEGFRVDFTTTPPAVTDGPFAETHEFFNGYWMLEVASREEAVHWARKCPLGPGSSLEVRRVHDLADFDLPGDEWIEKEQEWRAANT